MNAVPILVLLLAVDAERVTPVGVRAVYDTTETTVSAPGSKAPGERVTRGTLTLRIACDVLAIREGDDERIYDFAAGRVLELDHARTRAADSSIYALAAFRHAELENRKAMARMLEAIGQQTDMADAEMELAMRQDPPAPVRLKEERRERRRVFLLNDRDATTWVGADRPLPPSLSPMVTRVYLYAAHLHPLVVAELAKEARLPAQLEFSWRLFQERTTVQWALREIVDEPFDVAATLAAYSTNPIEGDGVLEIASRVRSGAAGAPPPASAYSDRARRLLDGDRGFEAFLAVLELGFATGDTPADLLSLTRERTRSDPRMDAVEQAMEIERRDPKRALARLESIDASSADGGHVLHVLRANQHIRLQQLDAAIQEFGHALRVNPFLVGPWVDVGQLYYVRYQTTFAWRCWDAARAVAPGSPLLKRIGEREASLRERHPEYFRSP